MPRRKASYKRAPIKILPPVEYLRTCLDYNPDSGSLTWKKRPREHFATANACGTWNSKYAGIVAGCSQRSGHRRVLIDHCGHREHRVVWKWMTGEEPPATIDHIDRDARNNRWANLRPATPTTQTYNIGIRKDNTSGKRGVYLNRGRWWARITVNGVRRSLGFYSSVEEASVAYEKAARELHKEFYVKGDKDGSVFGLDHSGGRPG